MHEFTGTQGSANSTTDSTLCPAQKQTSMPHSTGLVRTQTWERQLAVQQERVLVSVLWTAAWHAERISPVPEIPLLSLQTQQALLITMTACHPFILLT